MSLSCQWPNRTLNPPASPSPLSANSAYRISAAASYSSRQQQQQQLEDDDDVMMAPPPSEPAMAAAGSKPAANVDDIRKRLEMIKQSAMQ